MDTLIFSVATLGAIGAVMYMYALGNIKDLKDNWQEYKCNPAYMPFAGFVGQDVFRNFTDCTMKSFKDYTGFVVDPIMSQFSNVADVVSDIDDSMSSMRTMMAQTRTGFLGIVGMVFGKLENLMSQFQYIIIRMRTLLARVIGIMMSFMYIFYGGMRTGESVQNGPIGQTISFLCFDLDTELDLVDGTKEKIKNVKLGTVLRNFEIVTSKYIISGEDVPMYQLGNVKVSGSHRVVYQGSYIKVQDHPDAIPSSECEILTCINTTRHHIYIGDHIFLDFVENTDEHLLKTKRHLLEEQFNGKLDPKNEIETPTTSFPTGFNGDTLVPLKRGKVPISMVKVDDILDNGDFIRGIAIHEVRGGYYAEIDTGINSHPCNWIFENGRIRTAESFGNINKCVDYNLMYNLISDTMMYPVISRTGTRYMVLDELRSRTPI